MKTVILKTLDEWRRAIAIAVNRGETVRHDHKKRERMVIGDTQYYLPAVVDMDLFERVLDAKRDLSDSAKAMIYKMKYEDALADMKLMEATIGRLQSKIDYLNRCLTSVEPDTGNTSVG